MLLCEKITPALCVKILMGKLGCGIPEQIADGFMKLHTSKTFLEHLLLMHALRLGGHVGYGALRWLPLPCLPASEHAPISVGMRQWGCHAHVKAHARTS